MKFNTSTPSGFPEFSPNEESVYQYWLKTISEIFAKYGFTPITTPLVEREENLLGKGGNPKEIYALKRVLDDKNDDSHSGNAMRFDHTVPLALYISRNLNELNFPFRRQAIGSVFRGERPQKGRYRQFDQCDIDVVGMGKLSFWHDAELVAVIFDIFNKLNIGNFLIRINNRKILTGFFSSLEIENEKMKKILDIVDNLEKIGENKVREEFAKENLNENQIAKILSFIHTDGSSDDILEKIKNLTQNEVFQTGIFELKEVIKGIKALKIREENYKIDLRIARGLDYYTSTVYETYLIGYESFGSICSGGRYDDLAEVFTDKKMPGVGISIGLTRLLKQLFEAKIIEGKVPNSRKILIITHSNELETEALKLAKKLRDKNLCVENYLEDKKFAKKMEYANKVGANYVLILGENEVRENKIMVKNMETGDQNLVAENEVFKIIK